MSDNDIPATSDAEERGELSTPTSEQAVQTALISGENFRAKPVQYVVVDGLAMFEGDIVLGTVEQVQAETEALRAELRGEVAAAAVISGGQYRWSNCQVPYDIDPALPNQQRVTDAIAHWQTHTRFTFVLRTAANAASFPDYVTFRPSSGCSSSVGRRGGQQFINLGSGCTTGNTIHEIGHTIGLWHEQSREDRDAHVTIHWDKIQSGREHNFNQHIADGDDVGAYDFGSIMHYPRNAFSVDGSDTITPTDPTATIGQRIGLSPGDIAAANGMCPVRPTIVETAKELTKEIAKERFETTKERLKEPARDTLKELAKERFETIKERIKEPAFDTQKERIETLIEHGGGTTVEQILPGGMVGPLVNPVSGTGADVGLPFAMATPYEQFGPGATPQPQPVAGAAAEADALTRLAALEEVVALLAAAFDAGAAGPLQ